MNPFVWMAEKVGYAIGAAVFGPAVMIERRTRKVRRRALATWIAGTRYTRLSAPKRYVRWLVERQDDELGLTLEVELAYDEDTARVVVRYERLPDRALATASKLPEWRSLRVEPEHLTVETHAPSAADEWEALVRGATTLAASMVRQFRAGYR